jgi:glyoxylase-like metal-dependent hydrolase (beta-lactamase superfamily II)
MKKFTLLILVASSLLFGFDYKLKPKEIANGVYMITGVNEPVKKSNGGAIANSYWIKTDKHWVVFDAGPTYDYAKQAYEAMKKVANLPIERVFNSHFHDDHWMGDSFYKELKVPIYATKAQKEHFKPGGTSRVLKILDKKDLKNTKIVTPDNVIDKSFTFKVDNREFKVIYRDKPAHGPQDFMLYLPKDKVLFTGDLLMSERITSIRHGSVKGNLEAIAQIEKIDPKVYANGHGKFTDKTGLKLTKDYLETLKKEAKKAIDDDIELEDFVKKADFSKFKEYKLFNVAHKENLYAVYNEFFDE